jgi:type III secretory pathway component EscV
MFRKILILLLMAPLWLAALETGTSLPALLLMGCLIIIALAVSSAREELKE